MAKKFKEQKMSYNTAKIVQNLKAQGEDFEWYPTSKEMIDIIITCINKNLHTDKLGGDYFDKPHRILDIGAGDGRVLKWFKEAFGSQSYMIELADEHIKSYDFGFVVGRDFFATSIIEKEFDMVFCNPPYSEFENFATRIIKEANAHYIALILPQRWRESEKIKLALQSRKNIEYEPLILGEFDFENADRKARAKVDVVFIKLENSWKSEDAFTQFLREEFNLNFDELENLQDWRKQTEEEEKFNQKCEKIEKHDLIKALTNAYNAELFEFNESLKSLNKVNVKLLAILDIKKDKLVEGIRKTLKELKGKYWNVLFNELDSIRSRITSPYREILSSQVARDANLDFTPENIYTILIWLIRNANIYIERSFLDLFDRLSRGGNAMKYKSNERFLVDSWRYNKDEIAKTPHKLDYRIVISYGANDYEIVDMIRAIANNLGYKSNFSAQLDCPRYSSNIAFVESTQGEIYTDKGEILLEYKAYKNKNVHIKFNKDFLGELNLAVGKIRQWIRDKHEARAEFKDLKEESFKKIFDKGLLIEPKNTPLCLEYNAESELNLSEDKPSLNQNEPSLFSEL